MAKKHILTEEELREGFRAAAIAYGELCMQIHEAIRPLREEAVEEWYGLQQWIEEGQRI